MGIFYKILVFIISFIPGLLWLIYFYRRDKHEPEPKRLIVKCFVFGIISAAPAAFLEHLLSGFLSGEASLSTVFSSMFLIVGPTEEFMKFLFMVLAIRNAPEFNDVIDGFIYAGAVALGFASIENFIYLSEHGTQLILLRGPLSTLAHVLFSGYWGLAYAEVKLGRKKQSACFLALLAAAFLHGLFNFVLAAMAGVGVVAIIALMIWMWRKTSRDIDDANARSEFKPANRIKCPGCGKYYYVSQEKCPHCKGLS